MRQVRASRRLTASRTSILTLWQIKKALDPLCLLNTDKVVRMEQPKKGEVAEW